MECWGWVLGQLCIVEGPLALLLNTCSVPHTVLGPTCSLYWMFHCEACFLLTKSCLGNKI